MPCLRGAVLLVCVASLAAARAVASVTSADLSRAVEMTFMGAVGAAGGDLNADGRATAADVTGAELGLRSPTQPGPFGVGIRQILFTKKSESMPDQDRMLLTDVWYPTAVDAQPVNGKFDAVVNAPLADGATHLPLLLFSHGSCGFPEQSLFLTPLIASYGFIVAAPPHPGNTLSDLLSGAGCDTPAELVDSYVNREADIEYVLDQLLALDDDSTSFLFQAIDPNRIGMSGHSFGGQTTLRVCADDPRIIGGLALAPALGPVQAQAARIAIPMMVQDGEVDTLAPFTTNSLATYDLLHAPRYLLEILDAGHFAFSDGCFPGFSDCGPNTLTQDEAHLYVLRYAVPYVLHWLAGDARFDTFLDPAVVPPGAVLTADIG